MEDSEVLTPSVPHESLSSEIISEYDLAVMLGISSQTLGDLRRNKGLPYRVLNRNNRVYLIKEVVGWLNGLVKV